MGKFGWKSGSLVAQNIQGGTVDITTDVNGDGTASVTFKNRFNSVPAIVLTARESDTTGTLSVTSPTISGFTAKVDGSSVTSGTLTVSWIAVDDSRRK